MKKKSFLIALCSIWAIGTLTGCGAKKTETAKPEAVAEEITQEEGLSSGEVHLTVWSGSADEELMNQMIASFTAEHKDEANITIEWSPMEEGDCRSALLGDALNGPDVYTTTDGDIQTIVSGGCASPVRDQEAVKSENIESAVDALTIRDTLYGYPLTADNGYFLFYNKAYFSDEDVKSLDTILARAAENGKIVMMDWTSGWYVYSFFGLTGMNLGLNEDGVTNHCDWNRTDGDIKGVDVAQAMLDIAANPGFRMGGGWNDEIAAGNCIACVSGVWDGEEIKAQWGENFAACKLPTYTVNGTQLQMASFFGYKMVGVNPYSKNLAWAHEFARYITSEENQVLRCQVRGQGPSNKNAASSSVVSESKAVQAVLSQAEFSVPQRIGGNYWNPSTNLGNTMAALNPEGKDLQEFMDETVEAITAATVQ